MLVQHLPLDSSGQCKVYSTTPWARKQMHTHFSSKISFDIASIFWALFVRQVLSPHSTASNMQRILESWGQDYCGGLDFFVDFVKDFGIGTGLFHGQFLESWHPILTFLMHSPWRGDAQYLWHHACSIGGASVNFQLMTSLFGLK